MTAFYIYARKIKISLFVMAKYRFWAAFSRGKVHDEILPQEHYKYARNYRWKDEFQEFTHIEQLLVYD